jgi:peptidoglycan/LPS O-acetylase OafA/YrhL
MKNLLQISNIKRIEFRNDINGLRAIAVLAVVFYHAELGVLDGGWLGVDIFLVISGYLISNIIISELNLGIFSFRNFYMRRIKRIIPGLFFALLLTIPFSYFLLSPKAMTEYINSLISTIFFYSNYYFDNLIFYNAEPAGLMPLLHTWSLAIEEQYYLLFPVVAYFLFKNFKNHFFLIISTLTFVSLFSNSLTQDFSKFYQLQFRVWELLLGVVLMIINSKYTIRHLEKIGSFLILFSIMYFDSSNVNEIEPKIIALLGVSLIILSNQKNTLLSKILSTKLLSTIGIISYSIYLLHQPLFSFFRVYKNSKMQEVTQLEKFNLILILLVISYISWMLVEKQFQKKTISSYLKVSSVASVIVIGGFIIVGTLNSGYSDRFVKVDNLALDPTFQTNELYLFDEKNNICAGFEIYCEYINNSDKKIILIGDSQSQTLQKYIYDKIKNTHSFIPLTSDLFFRCVFYKNDKVGDCRGNEKELFKNFIKNNKNSTYIFFSSYKRYEDEWLEAGENFSQVFDNILSFNNNLVVMYPIPFVYQNFDIKNLYINEYFQYGETIGYNSKEWDIFRNKIKIFFENKNGTLFIDPTSVFCNNIIENICVNAHESNIYYYDSIHLSHTGVELLVPFLFDQLDNNLDY